MQSLRQSLRGGSESRIPATKWLRKTGQVMTTRSLKKSTEDLHANRSGGSHWPTVLLIGNLLIASLFLFRFLFVWPFTPINPYARGDWYFAANPAIMMLKQGQLLYRDAFDFAMPGVTLLDALIFKFIGFQPWIPNVLSMLLGISLVGVSFVICKKVIGLKLAILPGSLYLLYTYGELLDPVHHFYSVLAGMLAVAVLLEGRTTTRVAAAGALCGISACFTQTKGFAICVGIAIFLIWELRQKRESWRVCLTEELYLAGAFAAVLLLVNAYFIWHSGVTRFFWCVFVFPVKYFPKQANFNSLMVMHEYVPHFDHHLESMYFNVRKLVLLVTTPCVLGAFFLFYLSDRGKHSREFWARPMLIACVGTLMFLSIANSPRPIRMAMGSLPALILLGWFASLLKRPRAVLAISAVAIVPVVLYCTVHLRPRVAGIVHTPRGDVAVLKPFAYQCAEYPWILQHTRPGEYLYAPLSADVYFYFDLLNPTPLSRIENNGYTTPDQVNDVIRGIEEHRVRYIYWSPANALDSIPKWEDPADAHLEPLRRYIRSHYSVAQRFDGNDLIWERRSE